MALSLDPASEGAPTMFELLLLLLLPRITHLLLNEDSREHQCRCYQVLSVACRRTVSSTLVGRVPLGNRGTLFPCKRALSQVRRVSVFEEAAGG